MRETNEKDLSFFLKGGEKGVLLIHGMTGTPSEMNYLGKALNKAGFTVFCNVLPHHCSTLKELKKATWQEIADSCADDLLTIKKECKQVFVGGLSMGALISVHLAYKFPEDVSGIIALAPTIFYDGWALHKGKALMNFMWHIPFLRNSIDIREGWPYGLKDEKARAHIESFYKRSEASNYDKDKVALFGSPFFPMVILYQNHLFTKVVKKEMPYVNKPVLIIHAREDDMTSPKSAEWLYDNIASTDKTFILLENSYHIITIDQEKDRVSEEVIKFLNNPRYGEIHEPAAVCR